MGLSAYCTSRKQDSNLALHKKIGAKLCLQVSYNQIAFFKFTYCIWLLNWKSFSKGLSFLNKVLHLKPLILFNYLIKVLRKWIVKKNKQTSSWIHCKVVKNNIHYTYEYLIPFNFKLNSCLLFKQMDNQSTVFDKLCHQ